MQTMFGFRGLLATTLLTAALFAGRADAGCGDGVLDGGEDCDPPGAACTTAAATSGTCSANCTCTLPSCGGDCGARCNDVRDQCMRQVDGNRSINKKRCKIDEKNAKQSCDEARANGELACLGFCPGSPEADQCLRNAHDTRQTCQDAAKTARDACTLGVDTNRDAGRVACDTARQICEASCS